MAIDNYEFPFRKKNETQLHYALKQIGKYFLYKQNYKIIAEEVYLPSFNELGKKTYTDVLGINFKYISNFGKQGIVAKSMSVEAKQSRSDYYNSFVSSADYNYVIVPKGMLREDDTYIKGVGIIEVDVDRFHFRYGSDGTIHINNPFLDGVEITKMTRRNKDTVLKSDNDRINLLRTVARRLSNESMYVKNGIVLRK